jgi:hypothetical protein
MQSVSSQFISSCGGVVRKPVAKVEVCWDGVHWTDESDYLISHTGTLRLNAPGADLIQPGDVDTATIRLKNPDGRYSVNRTDGPLYAYIGGPAKMTGVAIRLSQGFTYRINGTPTPVYVTIFTGVIYEPTETPADGTVSLSCKDIGWVYLQQKKATTIHPNVSASGWIDYLASIAGMAHEDRTLDPSIFKIPWCWLDDESIVDEMWKAAQSEGGRVWFDQLGKLRYEGPAHWLTPPHTVSQWTFDESTYQTPQYQANPDDLATEIVVEWSGRLAGVASDIYNLDTFKIVKPGETITWEARYTQPAVETFTPKALTDYWGSTPGGKNLTPSLVVTLSEVYAQHCTVTLTNNHPSMTATLSFFRLRGYPLMGGPSEQEKKQADPKPLPYDRSRSVRGNMYLQTLGQAKALNAFLVDRFKTLIPVWQISGVPGVPQLELGDRVTFKDAKSVTGEREGYVIEVGWDATTGSFNQNIKIIDAAALYPYDDFFIIGVTALGQYGRVWY